MHTHPIPAIANLQPTSAKRIESRLIASVDYLDAIVTEAQQLLATAPEQDQGRLLKLLFGAESQGGYPRGNRMKPLPDDCDLERAFLGSVLLRPEVVPSVLPLVQAGDFIDTLHSATWMEIVVLHYAGQMIEPVIIAKRLRDHHPQIASEIVEVAEFVHRIIGDLPTSAHAEHYAYQLHEIGRKRRIAMLANDLQIESLNGKASDQILIDLETKLVELKRQATTEQTSDDLFDRWSASVLEREAPLLFQVAAAASNLSEFEVGAGLVTLLGAPPGAGKTALVGQLTFDALRIPGQENLRLAIANVEMSPQALLDRQLSRLTGIGHNWIRFRDYDVHCTPKLHEGIVDLGTLMPRIAFMGPPFTLERLADTARMHSADIVVVDYAQRFDTQAGSKDQRTKANVVMEFCRRIAAEGRAVVVVSAVNRPQGRNGKYDVDSLGLASFRESSELEYGADAAYLLIRPKDDKPETILRCVKNRAGGGRKDIRLLFKGATMSFVDNLAVEGLEEWA